MKKTRRQRRPYTSLADWLDRTGTSQRQLAKMAGMTESAVSMLLRGSRRCSLKAAIRLSDITGVRVQRLVEWPRPPAIHITRNTDAAA